MDPTPQVNTGTGVIQNKSGVGKWVFILSVMLSLALGAVLGALGYFIFRQKDLPMNLSTLENPLFNQWMAGVDGNLFAKDSKTFTLYKNGKKLTIEIHKDLTGFVEASPSGRSRTLKEYTLDQIPLGSYLRGAVTILPKTGGGFTGTPGEHITANAFTIEKMAK